MILPLELWMIIFTLLAAKTQHALKLCCRMFYRVARALPGAVLYTELSCIRTDTDNMLSLVCDHSQRASMRRRLEETRYVMRVFEYYILNTTLRQCASFNDIGCALYHR